MSEKIVVPVLGESISEATVSKWLKTEGDKVEVDEPVVELETDKVNLEVPSPVNGILSEIISKNGAIVEVGALLGSISVDTTDLVEKEKIQKTETTIKENNVVNLELQKDEPQVFEKESMNNTFTEEPLVLTNEVQEENKSESKKNNQSLSPAVRTEEF